MALLIGLSLGLLGGGGSILAVPVLIYALDYPVKTAIPMSLVVVGLTSLMGAAQQARAGKVHWRAALAFGPPAVVGALGGAQLGLLVSDRFQLTIFAIVLIAGSLAMWFGPSPWSAAEPAGQAAAPRPLRAIGLLGALVGVLTGLIGVGGGFLYVPVLVLLAGLEMKQAVATSLALIVLSSAAGFARYAGTLPMDWVAILQFTLAAIVGVLVGSRLGGGLPHKVLRRGFAVFLLILGGVVLLFGRGGSPQ